MYYYVFLRIKLYLLLYRVYCSPARIGIKPAGSVAIYTWTIRMWTLQLFGWPSHCVHSVNCDVCDRMLLVGASWDSCTW